MTNQTATALPETLPETMTISVSLLENLLHGRYEDGYAQGMKAAKSVSLGETGYGSGRYSVQVIEAKSKRELARLVKEMNYRRNGDNPGQAYLWTCQILRIFKGDDNIWRGICLSSVHFDI